MTFKSFNAQNGNAIQAQYVREIGKLGDFTYYLYMEEANPYFLDAIDPLYKDEYAALAGSADDVAAAFSFYEPQDTQDPYADLVGSRFEFITTDLDGNAVSSADLFAQSQVTMVNLWTTWCGPCIGEMDDLQAIYTRLQGKGGCVVGMMLNDNIDLARQIIAEHGVAYPIVLAPDTMDDFFRAEYVPSTFFVGPDGTVLAGPIVGAHVDQYEAALDSLLQE